MYKLQNYFVIISKFTLISNLTNECIKKGVLEIQKEEEKLPKGNALLLIDANAIAGFLHLKACIHYAIKSFQNKNNLANNLSAEILLYLTANRQISKAIKLAGISTSTKEILLIQLLLNKESKDITLDQQQKIKTILEGVKFSLSEFLMDISHIHLSSYEKVMENLAITQEEINLFIKQQKKEAAYNDVIEKIAIEKSALLNLMK